MKSLLTAVALCIIFSVGASAQEFRLLSRNCTDVYQGSGAQGQMMGKAIAQVDDWRAYVTMEAGSRVVNNVLRETILACKDYLPRIFQIVINATNGTGKMPMLVSYYFVDGKRLQLAENNIGRFQQAQSSGTSSAPPSAQSPTAQAKPPQASPAGASSIWPAPPSPQSLTAQTRPPQTSPTGAASIWPAPPSPQSPTAQTQPPQASSAGAASIWPAPPSPQSPTAQTQPPQASPAAIAPVEFGRTYTDCDAIFLPSMNMPYGSGWRIAVRTKQLRELAQEDFRTVFFEAALKKARDECMAKNRPASAAVVAIHTDDDTLVLMAWTDAANRSWVVIMDDTSKAIAAMEAKEQAAIEYAEKEKARAAAEQAKRDQAAAAQAAIIAEEKKKNEEARAALNAFIKEYRIETFVSAKDLMTNPFPYKGKVIGVRTTFTRMVSAEDALFDALLVTGVPATQFTEPDLDLFIVLRIDGFKSAKSPIGTDVQVPGGKYVGVHVCKLRNCRDILPSD